MKPPACVGPADAFIRACRYEWRHLAALTSTWILLAAVASLSVLTGLTVLLDLDKQHTVSSMTVADAIAWTPLSTQVPALCFFTLILGTGPVSTDLISGGARTTWLAVNGRRTAYLAKCAVGFTVGAAVAAVSALVGALSCAAALALAGAHQPAWGGVVAPGVRFVGWMGCWALLCLALVALVRSRMVAVLLLVLWPLIGERIAGALLEYLGLDGVGDWLPFAAGRAMLTDVSAYSADERPFAQALVGSELSPPVATAVFLAYAAAITAAGWWAYSSRDAKTP
ncbi:hypothetical protein SSP35_12_01180 [Streptomyces sp. NBRC 110611]|uniref:hypothetical protein n=1 Tax=Streptomyces sp. NBRC 110611 TaxID=1621259 RepID=UPI00083452DB|nr:hypothetical protein [Streptomyces sp. NBRC 110611]GAU69470.1 hypothetical protein SSP35_12_01180 [Streptomyces sp. NBRC 110611]